ncbi:interleukin-12 receptor subunit beta-2 [Xenentodon cancila]
MFWPWPVVIAVTVLAVQLCVGETSCVLSSSSGSVVHRGSSFKVYCTFDCKCQGSMYSDHNHPPKQQNHKELNLTTIYLNVVNIAKRTTYSCHCICQPAMDPCGLDISAGYPPDRPKDISCIYNVLKNENGDVVCTWNRGRETYLPNHFMLWVRTGSGNHTEGPVLHNVSSKGTESLSASFKLSRSVEQMSVWVQAQNPLGSVESSVVNYTLSDIVMPSTPVLGQPECSSRKCVIKVELFVRTLHLQIQYRSEPQQQWTTDPHSVVQMTSSLACSVSSLEPYRRYRFRARSKFSTGLWSQWSAEVSSSTQEEAPAQVLDVWFTHASDLRSTRVFWKEASMSRGKILDYAIRVNSRNAIDTINVSADARSYSLPYCADCEVTTWARNSKGSSPPATITTCHTEDKLHLDLDLLAKASNHAIAISWRKPETAPTQYVLEWYPEGLKLEELRWVKLGKNETHAVITGIRPYECYEGAVYVFHNKSSASKTRFKGVATVESAPENGPSFEEKVEGNKVTITWMELPRGQRRGCITMYTIYLENRSGHKTLRTVRAPQKTYIIKDLSPDVYSMWMSASTAKGEGPAGQKIKIFIEQDSQLSFLAVYVLAALTAPFLLCLCQSSALKRRFWMLLQFFTPRVVPDPANSKWAQDCKVEQGKMIVHLPFTNTALMESNEDANLVHVEEVFKQTSDTSVPTNISSQLPLLTNLSPDTELPGLLYPALTTYIKSFSHDSDSSNNTQTSPDTNSTFDDFPSQGPGNTGDWDENEEEEFTDINFFPSHNIFMEPLEFGGKLTLDAVKIDCSDFLQNVACD